MDYPGVALDGIVTVIAGMPTSSLMEPVMILPTLRNTFSLGVAQSTNYTTRTIFGSRGTGEVTFPPLPPNFPPWVPAPPTEIPFEFSQVWASCC